MAGADIGAARWMARDFAKEHRLSVNRFDVPHAMASVGAVAAHYVRLSFLRRRPVDLFVQCHLAAAHEDSIPICERDLRGLGG